MNILFERLRARLEIDDYFPVLAKYAYKKGILTPKSYMVYIKKFQQTSQTITAYKIKSYI